MSRNCRAGFSDALHFYSADTSGTLMAPNQVLPWKPPDIRPADTLNSSASPGERRAPLIPRTAVTQGLNPVGDPIIRLFGLDHRHQRPQPFLSQFRHPAQRGALRICF